MEKIEPTNKGKSFRSELFSMLVQVITPNRFDKYQDLSAFREMVLEMEPDELSPHEEGILQSLEIIEEKLVREVLAPAMGITEQTKIDELNEVLNPANAKKLDAIWDAGRINQLFDQQINLDSFRGRLKGAEPVEIDQELLEIVLEDKPEFAETIISLATILNKSIEMNKDGSLMDKIDQAVGAGQEEIITIAAKYKVS